MLATPLVVDVRPGAVKDLPELLTDQRISTSGRVAVAFGRSGREVVDELLPALRQADEFAIGDATVETATELADRIRAGSYDAVLAIGGGGVPATAKYAATRLGLPMVAVATNLAHDGIASPVSILGSGTQRGSYGVALPIGVVIDLDLVRQAPRRYVAAGVGDVVSNLSALADWQLSHDVTGEPVDGLAVTFARTAAEACCGGPTAWSRTSSSRHSVRPWCSPASRWRWPERAARAAVPVTRSPTRSTGSFRTGPCLTVSRSAWGRDSPPSCAATGSSLSR